MIDNLTVDDVSPSPFFFCAWVFWCLMMVWFFLIPGSFVIFQMFLNPWVGCEEYAECEWALELSSC